MEYVTKKDWLLTACLLGVSLLLGAFLLLLPRGDTVCVRVDGQVTARLPLGEDAVLELPQGNVIEIRDGGVRMLDADCPDKVCVHTGRITRPGQTIVCAPHRLTVSVEAGGFSGCFHGGKEEDTL